MKKLIFIIFVTFSLGVNAQIIATVDDSSKKVILKSDGTWEYQGQKNNFKGDGIWSIKYFIDDFGDPTDEGYIAHDYYIKGTFSNSATTNTSLNIFMIVKAQNDISVQLYEYAGNTPVQAYSSTEYQINIKDSNGKKHLLEGKMYEGGNRVYFDPSSKVNKFHEILLNEGEISVVLKNNQYGGVSSYKYKFNANGYKNVYNELFK